VVTIIIMTAVTTVARVLVARVAIKVRFIVIVIVAIVLVCIVITITVTVIIGITFELTIVRGYSNTIVIRTANAVNLTTKSVKDTILTVALVEELTTTTQRFQQVSPHWVEIMSTVIVR